MNVKWMFVIIIAAFISLLFLAYMLNGRTVNTPYLVTSLLLYLIVVGLRAGKLKIIVPDLSVKQAVSYISSSQLFSAFIPGRVGELVLSTLIKLRFRIELTRILPTLLVDKLLELFFVCFYFFVIGMIFYGSLIREVVNGISFSWVVLGSILFGLVIMWLLLLRLNNRYKTKLGAILGNIKQGLALPLANWKVGLMLFILSGILILIEYLFLYTVFRAYGVPISYSQIAVVHSIGMIVGVISLVPGGQGTTEVSMISVLLLWGFETRSVITPLLSSKIITYLILLVLSVRIMPEAIIIVKDRKLRRKAHE